MRKACEFCGSEFEPSKYTPYQKYCSTPCCQRAYSRRLKKEMIEAYGGKCECCGETAFEFLTLDHVDGKGREERHVGHSMYSELRKRGWPRDNLRLLCWNCNSAIGVYGHCPHQEEVEVHAL